MTYTITPFEDIEYQVKQLKRHKMQGYYDIDSVKSNYYDVFDKLGDYDKNDLFCFITLRLKNKVKVKTTINGLHTFKFVKTDYPAVLSVAKALTKIITRKFWKRKGKYSDIPMQFAIESNKGWFKEHLHGVIRLKGLKEQINETEAIDIIAKICDNIEEVNSSDKTAIDIQAQQYCEDATNSVAHRIEYICKSSANLSTIKYQPLIK